MTFRTNARRASASTDSSAAEPPAIAAQLVPVLWARASPAKARHASQAAPAGSHLCQRRPRGSTYGFTNLSVIRSLSPIASYFAWSVSPSS